MADKRPESEKRNERIRNLVMFKMYMTNEEMADAGPFLVGLCIVGGLVWAAIHYLT